MPSRKKIFPLRLGDELRAKAETKASALGVSLNAFVAVALHAYLAGELRPSRSSKPGERAVKLGRNDPCPCGSGVKFKRCCWSQTLIAR